MSSYDELRAVYAEAKAEYDRLETELAIARAKMRAAERAAIAEWRQITDTTKLDACKKAAVSSPEREAGK
jgi:IS5 family transposase